MKVSTVRKSLINSCKKAVKAAGLMKKPAQKASSKVATNAIKKTAVSGSEILAKQNAAFIQQKKPWQSALSHLDDFINEKNFLGSGGEASVYKLSDDFVLRLAGGKKSVGKQAFSPVQDIFEGRNFGQAIAKTQDGRITINKFVKGDKLYKINTFNVDDYLSKLRTYSKFSDDVLEDFVENVAFINGKGYRIDPNPSNFLFDAQTGKINIIDILRKNSSSLDLYDPYSHNWVLSALVDGHDIETLWEKMNPQQRKETFSLIQKLEQRLLPMCKKHNIPEAVWNRKDYTFSDLTSILSIKDGIDYEKSLVEQVIRGRYPEFTHLL